MPLMMAYASRTGTKRNLDALRAAGWGLMVSATGVHRTEGFDRYALDNGAWTAYNQGRPWKKEPFLRLLALFGDGADFVVVPDVVSAGLDSLRRSEYWLPRLDGVGRRRLIAVQDGMKPRDVRSLLCENVGIFLGGTTPWKLGTMHDWGVLARERGAYFHVGRVNTARRIWMCAGEGAHSFDGTSATKFVSTLPLLDKARRECSWDE